jgi:hypothetical protein
MRIRIIIMTLTLAIAIVLIEGCASFGDGGTPFPSPTIAPTTGTQSPGSTGHPTVSTAYVLPVLTDSQKSRAESLAKANDTVKRDILSKPQFSVTDVYADYPPAGLSDIVVRVTFEGRDAAHSDPLLWMPEQYLVFVDLATDRVTLITHVRPMQLPTPAPV